MLVIYLIIAFTNICFASDPVVEKALSLKLPVTDKLFLDEVHAIREKAFDKVKEGNYKASLEITLETLEKFPTYFGLQRDLATLLGDHANNFSDPLKSSMIERSKEIFQKLMNETDGQPIGQIYSFKNEYYYRFAQYKNQYELGLERVSYYWNTDRWLFNGIWGYYSQGVGAANYSKQLLLEGNKQLAVDYAQKALVAWAQFFSYDNSYYNSYVHYALALGILGFKDEMMKALEHAAKIINSDLNFHEFKDVIEFVNQLQN